MVLAYDEETGEQAFKPVVQLFRNTTDEWYHIVANGEEIVCTAEHPFYVLGLGFVPAKNLSITDKLLSSDNVVIDIDSITIETLSTPETTYNFEVADYHTYYVCESGVLVHNRCKLGKNMEKNGNIGKPGEDAHHVFPEKFKKRFKKLEININSPENGKYIDLHIHRSKAFEYNKAWEIRFDNGSVTIENVRQIASELMWSVYGEIWPK